MARNITNLAASVHQRLLNKAKETSRPFNDLLQRFAIERFIYRLSKSPYADEFVLKGASMLSVWSGPASRPTMDIDLLGKTDNSPDAILATMKDACGARVDADGMFFDPKTATAVRIGGTADKDFHDIWMLSQAFDFSGELLAEAIAKTFENRDTAITSTPACFSSSFAMDGDKRAQWQGFTRRAGLDDSPESFEDVIAAIKVFLEPIAAALLERGMFQGVWKAPGPWR